MRSLAYVVGSWLALAACESADVSEPALSSSSSSGAPHTSDDASIVPEPIEDAGLDAREVHDADDAHDADGSLDAGPPPPPPPPPETHDFALPCGAPLRFSLEEADTVRWTLGSCSGPVQLEDLPAGAVFADGVITWVPGLDRAGPFSFVVVEAGGARTRVDGMVLDRFDAPGNVPLTDRLAYREEHGLPVLHLTWHSPEPSYCRDTLDRDPVPADILLDGHAYAGAELRCRGATSLTFPKKSFTLRFSKNDPFHAPVGLERFEGRRRLVLTQTFDDNSQLRTRLAFELHARLAPENIAIDHASVVVFVDGEYQGLYQLTDNIGDHFMKARGFDPDGQMFKSVDHRGNYRAVSANGTPKPDLRIGYEKSDGLPEDDFAPLEVLLRWVTDSSDQDFENGAEDVLRVEDFIDWYVYATAIMARDSYGKNSYVYTDLDGPDPRWRYVPWDMNESFGQNWYTAHVPHSDEGVRPPWAIHCNGIWQRLLQIPAFAARIEQRYAEALAGPMSRASVLALYDQLHDEVRLSALRDDRKWDHARRNFPLFAGRPDYTDFDGESAYLRTWIEQRWQLLESLY